MSKPPKRPFSGKKPARNDARSPHAPSGRSDERAPKREGFSRNSPKDGARSRSAAPLDRAPSSRPARSKEKSAFRSFDEKPKEAKSNRLKADLFGIHAVREAWQNEKRYVHSLFITETALKEFEPSLKTTAKRPAPTIVTKDELDKAFPPGTVHQGIALSCQNLAETSLIDIIIKGTAKERSVIVILDQVTDPHNIGAILRSACAFGADGVVMQSKHAPELTGILAKTASGAADHIPVAYETNLSRSIETLKEHHYTVIGLDEHSPKTFNQLPRYERAVIVLGAEGPGMRRLIRDHCDVLVTLPTQPPVASLNVSNAAAVALYALTI